MYFHDDPLHTPILPIKFVCLCSPLYSFPPIVCPLVRSSVCRVIHILSPPPRARRSVESHSHCHIIHCQNLYVQVLNLWSFPSIIIIHVYKFTHSHSHLQSLKRRTGAELNAAFVCKYVYIFVDFLKKNKYLWFMWTEKQKMCIIWNPIFHWVMDMVNQSCFALAQCAGLRGSLHLIYLGEALLMCINRSTWSD